MSMYERNGVTDGDFGPIDEQIYDLELAAAEEKTTKSKGQRMLVYTVKIVGPAAAGRQFWMNCVMEGKALFVHKKLMAALGIDPNDVEDWSGDGKVKVGDTWIQTIGMRFEGDLTNREHDGKNYIECRDMYPKDISIRKDAIPEHLSQPSPDDIPF